MNERILCAATKRIAPRNCHNTYYEGTNDILNIELGYRHADILHRFQGEVSKNPYDQGFYTSKGRFINRQEAFKIAEKESQLIQISGAYGTLYSEDLY